MIAYWGAFVKNGRPAVDGQPRWPALNDTQRLLALRAGKTSTLIRSTDFAKQHNCTFWG